MNKLVSRSLEILGKSVADVGKEYTSNVTSFINDAREVRNNIVKTTTDASDTFAKLKTADITKKISDWFYGEENSYDASMGDDFDPGFKVDSSDEPKLDGEKASRALDADSMGSITEKQTSMMLKIGRRQSEQSVANTAEIISVVNNRTSEMITSMNNINKTLIGISERIDKIIALQGVAATEGPKAEDKNALFQDGKLSLARIFDVSKQNLSNNSIASTASIFLQSLTSGGGFGPDALASLGLSLLTGRKMDTLGGHSIDDIGKKFNEVVGAGIQTALNEAINSGPFQKIFGNISGFNADQNYKDIVPNHYDTKRAMFDGMTRQSIVNVIPEMLAKINESISGNSYHLDNRGQWIKGPRKNEFAEVTQASFATANLSSRATAGAQRIFLSQQGRSVSDDDIKLATKALTMAIVMTKHYNGNEKGSFTISEFERDMSGYLDSAIKSLCTMRNDPAHWNAVCNAICVQLSSGLLDASAFVQNVNSSLDSMKKQAIAFAQSGKQNASQASTLSLEMAVGQLFNEYRSGIKTTQEANKPTGTPVVKKDDRSYELGRYGMGTYVKGIFGILNRGINVRVDQSGKKYEDYDINKIDPEKSVNTDDEFGKLFAQAMSGGGLFGSEKKGFQNMIKMGVSNKLNGLLGISDDAGGVGGGGGFLSSLFGVGAGGLLSGAMRSVGESLYKGTFKEDTKKFFSDEGRGGQFINSTRDRVSTAFNNSEVGQSLAHDKRWIETKEYLTHDLLKSISEKAKNAIGVAGDKLGQTGLYQKGYQLTNNALYYKDEASMNLSANKLSNIDIRSIEEHDDKLWAARALNAFKSGNIDEALMNAENIKDEGLKKVFDKHLNNIKDISDKRVAAETTMANGGEANIGAAIKPNQNVSDQDLNKSYQGGGLKGLIYTGFRFMGSVFRNTIGKSLKRMRYGAASIFEGIFGGKQKDKYGKVMYDENGNVIKAKGLVNLITDPMKFLGSSAVKFVKDGDFRSGVSKALGISKEVSGDISDAIDKTKGWIDNTVNKTKTSLTGFAEKLGLKGEVDKLFGQGSSLSDLMQGFRDTRFGRGFMQSFDAVNNYKRVRKAAEQEKAELEDSPVKTKGIQSIVGFLTGETTFKDADGNEHRSFAQLLKDNLGPMTEEMRAEKQAEIDALKEQLEDAEDEEASSIESSEENKDDEKDKEDGDSEKKKSLMPDIFETIKSKAKSLMPDLFDDTKGDKSKNDPKKVLQDVLKPITDAVEKKLPEAIEKNSETVSEAVTDAATGDIDTSSALDGSGKKKSLMEDVADKVGDDKEGDMKGKIANSLLNTGGNLVQTLIKPPEMGGDLFGSLVGGSIDMIGNAYSAGAEAMFMGMGDKVDGMFSSAGATLSGGGAVATPMVTGGGGAGGAANAATQAATQQAASQAATQAAANSATSGAMSGAMSGAGGAAAGGGSVIGLIVERILGVVEAIGKVLGGIANFVKGIIGAVISTALAMESFKAIKKVVNDILVDGVKPLSEAFDDIRDALEPVADAVTDMLEEMMIAINDLLEISLEIVKPILLELEPLFQEMLTEFLKPLLKDIMVPLFVSLKLVLPYIEMIAYSMEIVIGSLESVVGALLAGFGYVTASLGMVIGAIGTAVDSLPFADAQGVVDTGSNLVASGQKTASDGLAMMQSGATHTKSGYSGLASVLGEMFSGYDYNKFKTEDKKTDVADTNEVNMAGELGAGDVNTNTYNYSYMYGSGNTMNQHTYGSYMNMSERGCGPVVLADAYNRRNGGMMNPATLASTMLGAGTYDPARGTQTGDLMRTSGMLGMPLRMGGVTQKSLKKASPDNPITILGSGAGFGTKIGNNHYVNVIGTDSNGGAYVSNPMTGRVERQSATMLALNSKLGLYGSGDDDDNDYGFDRKTQRALEKLRELTDNLTGMFVGNTSSYIKKAEDEATNKSKATRIESSLEEEEYAKLKARVIEELSRQNPKRDGETDEEYNKRMEMLFGSPEGQALLVKYDSENGESSAVNAVKNTASSSKTGLSGMIGTFTDALLGEDNEDGKEAGFFAKAARSIVNFGNSILNRGNSSGGYSGGLTAGTEEEQIFDYLRMHYGMSDAGAAGVMGVFQNEGRNHAATLEGIYSNDRDDEAKGYKTTKALNEYSLNSLFPMYARSGVSISKAGYNSDGEYLPGIGMAQWTGARTRGLINYAKNRGKEWYDLQTQLDYIGEEKSGYGSLFELLKSAKDPSAAADAWMTQFEAGCSGTNPAASWLSGSQISARRTSAKDFYNKYNGRPLPSTTTGGSLIDKAAMVFEAAVNNNGGVYSFGDVGKTTLRDGTVLPHFRQDCSGLVSAAVQAMGYGFNAGDNTGIRTWDLSNRNTQDLVTKNGTVSDDWEILPYAHGRLKPGDIVTSDEHMSIYMSGPDTGSWSNRGFDGGSGLGSVSPGKGIQNSAAAGKAYLSGDPNWASKLHATHSGADGLKRILRYVGGGDDELPPVDQSLFDDLYSNLNNNGMSTIINKYDIKSDKQELDTILDKMGKMTFNVRAQRVEELLEELIEKVSDEKPKTPTPSYDSTDTNLFRNRPIPAQIQRLARG